MKNPIELEKHMLHPDKWSLAPHPIREIAEEVSKEGTFTGIAWDTDLGWVILQRPSWSKPPVVAWSERGSIEDVLNDIDYDDLEFEWP